MPTFHCHLAYHLIVISPAIPASCLLSIAISPAIPAPCPPSIDILPIILLLSHLPSLRHAYFPLLSCLSSHCCLTCHPCVMPTFHCYLAYHPIVVSPVIPAPCPPSIAILPIISLLSHLPSLRHAYFPLIFCLSSIAISPAIPAPCLLSIAILPIIPLLSHLSSLRHAHLP